MWRSALADADRMLARCSSGSTPTATPILVLSPVAPVDGPALGVAVADAPGVDGGFLRSATTRRDGYVQLADVAPTIARTVRCQLRRRDRGPRLSGEPGRRDRRRLRSRSGRIARRGGPGVGVPRPHGRRPWCSPCRPDCSPSGWPPCSVGGFLRGSSPSFPSVALAGMGAVSATFLVGLAGTRSGSLPMYVLLVVAVTAALVTLALLVERRVAGGGLMVALGTLIVVIAGGLVVGAPLQVNTIFGYSVAVAGRFTGLGNLAFALLGSATIILASVIADRFGRNGRRAAVAVLVAVVLIEGLPVLGGDVGGVLSMVPAFGVTALILQRSPGRVEGVGGVGGAGRGDGDAVRVHRPGPSGRRPHPPGPAGRARPGGPVALVLRQPAPAGARPASAGPRARPTPPSVWPRSPWSCICSWLRPGGPTSTAGSTILARWWRRPPGWRCSPCSGW